MVKKMRRAAIAAALGVACTQLNGCFFIFIPGSVVGAISDSVTGAKGDNCVSSTAKVGDQIRTPDGNLMRVKSLSGSSTRCTNDKFPLRAELELVPVSVSTEPTIAQLPIDLALTTGWTKNTLTPAQIADGFKVVAANQNIDGGVSLAVGSRVSITDNDSYVQSRRASHLSKVDNGTATTPVKTIRNGRDDYSFEVKGTLKSGLRIHYLVTITFTQKYVLLVTSWTSEANMENQRALLATAPNWVTGIE